MTEQKKSASPDALTETGNDAKIELTEEHLNDVAGGALDACLPNTTVNLSSPAQAASLNFALKL